MFPFRSTYVKKSRSLFSGPVSFLIIAKDSDINTRKRGNDFMNVGMMIVCVIGGLAGVLSTAYLMISLPVVIIWKFYRRVRFGYNMYQ